MADGEHETPRPSRWRRTLSRIGVAALLFCVALAGLWLARKPIARGFIDRELAAAKVPGRYTVEELGFGRQRLTDIVIGDPQRPDLVADWVELETSVGLNGARVEAIRAGKVLLRARMVDGALSLGSLDRLLPKGSGGAFRLPAVTLSLDDGRMRLETPGGVVGLKASGAGRLDGGFRGKVAAITDRIATGGCAADKALAVVAVDIRQDAIRLTGPVRAATAGCAGSGASGLRADLDASVATDFARWHGVATLAADNARAPSVALTTLGGTVRFAGDARGVQGKAALTAERLAAAGLAGQAGRIDGAYSYRDGRGAFTGTAKVGRAALGTSFAALGSAGAGTPVGPIAQAMAQAIGAAARDFALTADLSAATDGGRGAVKLTRLFAVADSGASVQLTSDGGAQAVWPDGGVMLRGDLVMGGGGLPDLSATLDQVHAGAPITGIATMEPYQAGKARLALAAVRFSAGLDGRTRIESVATLTGPIGNGGVEGLRVPLIAQWDGRGRLSVNPACAPVAAARLRVAGIDARNVATQLCPVDGAMFSLAGGRLGGGAAARDLRLAGAVGSSPMTLAAATATLRLAQRSFAATGVAVRIGPADRQTRLDVDAIDGGFANAVSGQFRGAGGQIGAVPLILSQGDGGWRMAEGKLLIDGALAVADAAHDPRFRPLAARDVAFTLSGDRIHVTGVLARPGGGAKVADVRIDHDLTRGVGSADLTVAGLTFDRALQPDMLTPLAFGVIADVAGTITGGGHIAWTPQAVTSTGTFRTRDMKLAAAFGTVSGLSTELRFSDLLGMISAPDQVATVKSVDTGIAVADGVIHYRILGPDRVEVADARWPFAGGQLSLEPTLLDFADPGGRRFTFELTGVDAAQFLQQFDFKNLNATGIFDGALPMIFDANGGRIVNGRLKARAGGSIAYVGEVTKEDVGFWGNLAFQALKSLKYRALELTMNGPLAGEVITEARFAGVSQGTGAKSNFLVRRLQKLPFVFNVKIRAPFRQLFDSAATFANPRLLLRRQRDAQSPTPQPVQPPASEGVP